MWSMCRTICNHFAPHNQKAVYRRHSLCRERITPGKCGLVIALIFDGFAYISKTQKSLKALTSNLLLQRLKHGPNWIDQRTKVKRYWWVLRRLIKNRPLGCIRGLFTSNPWAFSKQAASWAPVFTTHLRCWQRSASE